MPTTANPRRDLERKLITQVARFAKDPLGFVRFAYPWGDGDLAEHAGPRQWQEDELRAIAWHLAKTPHQPYLSATSSGHGIGKSALVSWLIHWGLSTCVDTKVVVTANTATQLQTKTWPELAIWHNRLINRHWFKHEATSVAAADVEHKKTWRADAIPWSEHSTEAFAGLHNQGRRIILIFDEASAIADRLWEVAEGALTDQGTEILWFAFGNPTLNTGRFKECFGRFRHRYRCSQIDARSVPGTNRELHEEWARTYGEDSDFFRVRVRGVFPRAGIVQFISSEIIEQAAKRPPQGMAMRADPVVAGLDVARFGDDESVLAFRCGRDAKTVAWKTWRGLDTMQLAGAVAAAIEDLRNLGVPVDALYVDETGVGGGVVDRLRQLHYQVVGVNNGGSTDCPVVEGTGQGELVANKGAECWARMRLWLKGGAIPDDRDLVSQLESRMYGFNQNNEILLEKKADMKKRGLASPDRADALALTFAYPVQMRASDGTKLAQGQPVAHTYDPMAALRSRPQRPQPQVQNVYDPLKRFTGR